MAWKRWVRDLGGIWHRATSYGSPSDPAGVKCELGSVKWDRTADVPGAGALICDGCTREMSRDEFRED